MSKTVGIVRGGLKAAVIDGEDAYWRLYRHCFLAQCVKELSAALKKLHAYHPGLAQGGEPKANLAELSRAVRASPEFRERQASPSLHIDICARLVAQYWGKRLAEVRKVEQGIAVGHKTPHEKPGWRAAPDEGCGDAPASASVSSLVACGFEQHRRVEGGQ
ncbi:putative syntaxin binding protein 1 [Trypanosoma cruzi]|uniref:Putative syntaxin binding protein 1 n=1 Tax=Trypanosoma cruzi TaxID=5693 RepID=A0A2V2VEU4_TRYCR|nr:putative syntaxin binding protein 1 [Trypanosoma cruzi]